MNAFSTPEPNKNAHRRFLSGGNGRRCFVDKSLPNLSGSFSKTPSPANQLNYSLDGTPNIRNIVHDVSKSTGAKRKLVECSRNSDSLPKRTKLDFTATDIVPMYNNYQLLGDSQFVRFSEKMLSLNVTYLGKKRFIGYCVSGQKIDDLRLQICANVTTIHSQVIVLIGTNDIVYRSDYKLMCNSYKRLLEMLKRKCRKIVLLTVPPVPKFEASERHWTVLKKFNKFIQQQKDEQITVIDLCSLFISFDNTVSKDYFEQVYNAGPRQDLIHLNLKGFKALKFLLDLHLNH